MHSPGFGGRQPRGGMELEPAWESPVSPASASSFPVSVLHPKWPDVEWKCAPQAQATRRRTPLPPRHVVERERSRVGPCAFVLRSRTSPGIGAPVVLSPVRVSNGTSVGEQPPCR